MNLKIVGGIVAALVLGFGIFMLFSGGPSQPVATPTPTLSALPGANLPTSGERTGATLPLNSRLTIQNQTAGGQAVVELALMAKPGFVVIQRDTGGLPGDIIGASAYLDAGEHRNVPVSAGLADGQTYWAVLYLDSGDKAFSAANDFPLKDDYGRFIGSKFGASGPPVTVRPTASASPAVRHDVAIVNFAFSPANLTVRKGDTVVYTNKDSAAHTVTAGAFGAQHVLLSGQSYTLDTSALAPGSYSYLCDFHPFMKGTITVQ